MMKVTKFIEKRPYPNEHAARIKEPDQYDAFMRHNDEFGEGIHVIYGIKDGDNAEVQSIRFDSSMFTPEEAKVWLDENDYEYIKFENAIEERAIADIDFSPTKGMMEEAQRGLDWRKEFGRGGTAVGVARARDISNGRNLSPETVKRMYSYFSRHEVDKEAEGFNQGEDGYPSNGRIAWALWSGDQGFAWSKRKVAEIERETERNLGESKDSNDNLHIKEELIMSEENMIPSENEGNETESKSIDRVSGEERMYRSVDLSRSEYIDEEKRTVRIALTSEAPVKRSFGLEILDHAAESINTDFISQGRSPLLLDHDMTKQIGIVESFELDQNSKRTIAKVRFGRSALADEVFNDVVDGIRTNVSVGYAINNMERDTSADEPTYRINWTPLEASIVSIPADQSANVGVARSEPSEINPTTETESIEETVEVVDQTKSLTENKGEEMSEVEKKDVEINIDEIRSVAVSDAKRTIAKENDEILELGYRHNQSDLARKAIREGVSIEDFRGQLLNSLPVDQPLDTKEVGLNEKEIRQFSILKAVRAMANPADRKAQEEAAFEFEASDAAKSAYGRHTPGLTLPSEVMGRWFTRDINTSDDSGALGTDFRGGSFIDALRNGSAVIQAGATILRDLQNDVKIPKQSGTSTAAWISAEGGAASESELTMGSVSMSPKTASVYTEVTNQMMQQSTLDMELIIRNDLAGGIANLIDTGALAGSGSSGQPTGVDNLTGVNTVTFAALGDPTYAEIVSLESAVTADNVIMSNPGYLTNSTVAGAMKSKSKDTGSGTFVIENGEANGHPVYVSNAVAANVVYFGNWSDLLIGFFGGLDLLVDPYSGSANSITRLRATQFVDIAARHGQSFCKGSGGS